MLKTSKIVLAFLIIERTHMILDWLLREKRIPGDTVDLVLEKDIDPEYSSDHARNLIYGIYLHKSNKLLGTCDLRVGMNEELYFSGNIGYRIYESNRGHHYAYYACEMLFDIAKDDYAMDKLIITCSPDNIPSRKTLEKLGGTLLEVAEVPSNHWLYKRGETIKNIYEYILK